MVRGGAKGGHRAALTRVRSPRNPAYCGLIPASFTTLVHRSTDVFRYSVNSAAVPPRGTRP